MLIRALVVALAISVQIAFLGPLDVISRNASELGVGPGDIMGRASILGLCIVVCVGGLLYGALRLGYSRIPSVAAALAVYLYLQYYFFVPDLGVFDGRTANFSGHGKTIALEVIVLVALLVMALLRPDRAVKTLVPLLGILAVAESAIAGAAVLQRPPAQHATIEATKADLMSTNFFGTSPKRTLGIPELSTRNVIVILLDTLQADLFISILQGDAALENAFGGFTIYRNSAGVFPFTGMSVATLLTGTRYDGREKIPEYLKRVASRQLAARFDALGYEVDLLPLGSRHSLLDADKELCRRVAATYDLALLRQVPTLLKEWQYNDSRFRLLPLCGVTPKLAQELDPVVLGRVVDDMRVSRSARPRFKFMHFYAMHPPGKLTESCETRERAIPDKPAVAEQAKCVLRHVQHYLEKLRALGVYDSSLLVITADHGTLYGLARGEPAAPGVPARVISAAHPTIAFKDFGASGPVRFSEAPASLLDIYPTIAKRVGFDSGQAPGRDLGELKEDERRFRDFFFYRQALELVNRDYVKQSYWFANYGNIAESDDWGATVAAEDKASIHLVEPWLNPEGVRILAKLPAEGQLAIAVDLVNPGPERVVRVTLGGRDIASWPVESGSSSKKAIADLRPEELGQIGSIELQLEQSSAPVEAAVDGKIRLDLVRLGEPSVVSASATQLGKRSIAAAFGKRGSADILIKDGWEPPDQARRRTVGSEASLMVYVGDPAAGRLLRLRARIVAGKGSIRSQPVELVANGRVLATWEIKDEIQWHEAKVPSGTATGGMLDMALRLKSTPVPAGESNASALKPPSIAVYELTIEEDGN